MGTNPPPAKATSLHPDRLELSAGLEFLNRSPEWDALGLRRWFEEYLVTTGAMRPPVMVNEPSAGVVALYVSGPQSLSSQRELPNLLAVARESVLTALRGLTAAPCDDRFLAAAIFSGRVMRRRMGNASRWMARPESSAPLSGIVLSLFAVDALTYRELYDKSFCLCDVCDRITFHHSVPLRRCCPDHLAQQGSGVMRKVVPPKSAVA